MSTSVQIDNRVEGILILGEGLTEGLDDINFTQSNRRLECKQQFLIC